MTNLCHDRQSVGVVHFEHADDGRGTAVVQRLTRVFFRTHLHTCDIPQQNLPAVFACAHDDVFEFLWSLQTALCVNFKRHVRVGRIRTDGTSGGLHVLRLDGVGNLADAHVETTQFQRIQPNTHGVRLVRKHKRLTDAFQT